MIHSNLLITRKNKEVFTFLMKESQLVEVKINTDEKVLLHSIRVGKVKNIVKNIQAAFVEMEPGQMGYLPLEDCKNAIITNRSNGVSIQEGDEVLVQVCKEAVKTKDPVLTTNLVFSGKYAILSTGKKYFGYSNKFSKSMKMKMKEYFDKKKEEGLLSTDFGVIIRTNAGNISDYQVILNEIGELEEKLKTVINLAKYRTCYSVLYQEDQAYLKELRDFYERDYEAITTDDAIIYKELLEMSKTFPNMEEKIRFYSDEKFPMWKLYSLDSKLEEALGKRVWLKSGGYLIIEPTEALVVIDVNSGKYSKASNPEDTAFLVNKEAAIEIGRQLRLRNISGIIIIDFINMQKKEQQTELLKLLDICLKRDSVPTSVVGMTSLGLVEVTRKKVEKSLKEQWNMINFSENKK